MIYMSEGATSTGRLSPAKMADNSSGGAMMELDWQGPP